MWEPRPNSMGPQGLTGIIIVVNIQATSRQKRMWYLHVFLPLSSMRICEMEVNCEMEEKPSLTWAPSKPLECPLARYILVFVIFVRYF